MSLFLLTFFVLYGGMHYYGYRKLVAAFPMPTPIAVCLILFMAVLVCAPILVRLAERNGLETLAVLLAYAGYSWMGLLFLFCVASITIDAGCLLARMGGALLGLDATLI